MNPMDNHTPSLSELIAEQKHKQQLLDEVAELNKELSGLMQTVRTLREAEQTLRQNILQQSHTLSLLYELSGKLSTIYPEHSRTNQDK